jgi:hypothetical protein
MVQPMKKSIFPIALFLLIMSLSACGSNAPTESAFKRGFSLNAIVEANGQYLLEEARALSGSEVGGSEPFIQKSEEVALRIDPGNTFEFMEAVRTGIEQTLLDSNARIVGTETGGNDHFAFTYTESGLHGTIHVWGVPAENSGFKLIVLITEG